MIRNVPKYDMNSSVSKLSTLTSGGRVTLPKRIRRHLGLKSGDQLAFITLGDGRVVLRSQAKPGQLFRGGSHELAAEDFLGRMQGDSKGLLRARYRAVESLLRDGRREGFSTWRDQ